MNDILAVAEDLHLDVAGALHQLFDIEAAIAKRGLGLARRLREQAAELFQIVDDPDAAAAAARRRLDQRGKAGAGDRRFRFVDVVDAAVRTGDGRHAGRRGGLARLDLVAEQFDRCRRRPDEDEAGRLDRAGEGCVFGEKTVTWVHRLCARPQGGVDDGGDIQVGLGGGRRPDFDRLVGEADC